MKKTDIAIVAGLFILLIGWITLYPKFFQAPPPQAVEPAVQAAAVAQGTNGPAAPEIRAVAAPSAGAVTSEVASVTGQAGSSNAAAETGFHSAPAPHTVSLCSTSVCLTISSWGGGVVAARLEEFPELPSTNRLVLDFSAMPSLAYGGLPGLSTNFDFVVSPPSNGTVWVTREAGTLRFVRSISFVSHYLVRVKDQFTNLGSESNSLPRHSISIGPMRNNKGETASMGYADLGVDSQTKNDPDGPRYWGNGGRNEPALASRFLPPDRQSGCTWFAPPLTRWLAPEFDMPEWDSPIDWVAVKSKFFVQILAPGKDETGAAIRIHAKRSMVPAVLQCTEGSLRGKVFEIHGAEVAIGSASNNTIVLDDPSVPRSYCVLVKDGVSYAIKPGRQSNAAGQGQAPVTERRLASVDQVRIGSLSFMFRDGERPDIQQTWAQAATIQEVSSAMIFDKRDLAPNATFTREIDYFVGPKKYPLLKEMGKHSVMEFGFLWWLCEPLLWIVNVLYVVAPNYGVVIILLTILIRLVFWPIMQKSAANSRKMQELQPQLAALKEQYKDDQQTYLKKQQELFKLNKVSVLGGCLPMLIQMPILFSLFYVLRSAVELRGAEFLWITDLSEAERLFPGIIPFWPHHINILPVLMTVVQVWQMKITPTPGDQQMQKMMVIFMPVFMLYLLYDMPSGLVLYWTVSQVLAILQIILEKKRNHAPLITSLPSGKK